MIGQFALEILKLAFCVMLVICVAAALFFGLIVGIGVKLLGFGTIAMVASIVALTLVSSYFIFRWLFE